MKNNCKNGNPKKKSEFICLSCGRIIMDGIQRPRQREDVNEIRTKIPELKREYGYK